MDFAPCSSAQYRIHQRKKSEEEVQRCRRVRLVWLSLIFNNTKQNVYQTGFLIFTARKRSLRRLCFHRCLSVQGEGVSAPLHAGIHTHRDQRQTPPSTWDQRQTPPRSRHPHETRGRHPPRTRHPPERTPLGTRHPPGSRHLLECILVIF